jgi:hypothetical protein
MKIIFIFNRKIIGISGDLSGMEAHCSSTFSDGEVISQQVLSNSSILDLTPLKCDRTPPSRDCSQRSKNVILGTAYSIGLFNRLIFGVLKLDYDSLQLSKCFTKRIYNICLNRSFDLKNRYIPQN